MLSTDLEVFLLIRDDFRHAAQMDMLTARAECEGFFTRADAFASGYDDRAIARARRAGIWDRLGPGLYAFADAYRALTTEQQHVVRCRAVVHRLGNKVVLTHRSAAIFHGIAVWGTPIREVDVTRIDTGRGRHQAGVAHHLGKIDELDYVDHGGFHVAKPARAVWEVACASTLESGLVTVDSALNSGSVSIDELRDVAGRFAHWQGSRAARIAMRLADAGAESPGESRSRFLFYRFSIPRPELQHEVRTSAGQFVARTDFAWLAYRHLGEFDGMVKYNGAIDPDIPASKKVTDEKVREDLARAESYGMSRIIWRDLDPKCAADTASRIHADLARSRSLYTRNRNIFTS